MKRVTLTYLFSYLLVGGLGFLLAPDFTLRIMLSNGEYGDAMPRVVGVLMVVLGGLIFQFVRRRDYNHYAYTVVARSFIVLAFFAIYAGTRDPLFLVLNAIVLIGLLPSMYVLFTTPKAAGVSH